MVPSGLCFVMETQLERIDLTHNCLAFRELTVANVLLSRIDVHSSSIARFQCSCCGLSIDSMYVSGSLVVDARAIAMMIIACAEILTGLLVIRFVCGGCHECMVMPADWWALSFSWQRCRLWTTVSLDTGGAFSSLGGRDLTRLLAGRLRRLLALGRLWFVSSSVQS